MEIRITRKMTGQQILDEVLQKYGDVDTVRRRADEGDFWAKQAAADLAELDEAPEMLQEEVTTEEIIELEAGELRELTAARLRLIALLKDLGEANLSELTATVKRDKKNVSEDIRILERFGLVRSYRKGREKRLRRGGDKITITL